MNNNLIFDVGMHKGQDTAYYLSKGYKVVAIDATRELIEDATHKFERYIDKGKLILINSALYGKDDEEVIFNISKISEWSSIKINISDRYNSLLETVKVPTVKLSTLFKKYGIPFYCKIDVEGYDEVCLDTLSELTELPQYISCETECNGEAENISEEQSLGTLQKLKKLGYKKFKLIDQNDLAILKPNVSFYSNPPQDLPIMIRPLRKIFHFMGYKLQSYSNRERISIKHNFDFQFGSTGPFGNNLEGKWLDFETARKNYLFHRREGSKLKTSLDVQGIWCDWHACL